MNKNNISYTLRRNRRSKCIRLSIRPTGQVIVTKPYFVSNWIVERFIIEKSSWILEKLELVKKSSVKIEKDRNDYINNKEYARKIIKNKVELFSKTIGVKYNRISIKNGRTTWGSCSRKRNLNFSYKLINLPASIADYVIVHELCHLIEMNHSKRFWSLVEKYIPDYKDRRKELKKTKLFDIDR